LTERGRARAVIRPIALADIEQFRDVTNVVMRERAFLAFVGLSDRRNGGVRGATCALATRNSSRTCGSHR
jgi:hypothetical protein